jgi:hypothetical protein
MNSLSQRLQSAIAEEEPRLRAITEQSAGASRGEGWSRKQELGHLIDSSANNRARFIGAALAGQYAGPSYDGPGWVKLGGYAGIPWADVVDLWKTLNQALIVLLEHIPPGRLSAQCRIGDAEPVTLEFVIADYILHLRHHLDHILSREQGTEYPGETHGA